MSESIIDQTSDNKLLKLYTDLFAQAYKCGGKAEKEICDEITLQLFERHGKAKAVAMLIDAVVLGKIS